MIFVQSAWGHIWSMSGELCMSSIYGQNFIKLRYVIHSVTFAETWSKLFIRKHIEFNFLKVGLNILIKFNLISSVRSNIRYVCYYRLEKDLEVVVNRNNKINLQTYNKIIKGNNKINVQTYNKIIKVQTTQNLLNWVHKIRLNRKINNKKQCPKLQKKKKKKITVQEYF